MKIYLHKILITGGQGQIATAMRLHPLAQKFNLKFCAHHEMDITDLTSIEAAIEQYHPDLIVNTAAYTAVDKAEQEKNLAMQINADGTNNLVLACKKNNLPLLHLSTDYVFDGKKNLPYLETDVMNPVNFYGETKASAEKIICSHLKNYLILRVSGVFSEHGNNFLKTILRLSKEKNELTIVDDQITCPTYASDIAAAIFTIAANNFMNGIYHFCNSHPVSWYDFACAIIAYEKNHEHILTQKINAIKTKDYKTAAKRPAYSVLSCDKIYHELGIQQISWEVGLEKAIANIKSNIV